MNSSPGIGGKNISEHFSMRGRPRKIDSRCSLREQTLPILEGDFKRSGDRSYRVIMEGGCPITLVRGADNDYPRTRWYHTPYDFQ